MWDFSKLEWRFGGFSMANSLKFPSMPKITLLFIFLFIFNLGWSQPGNGFTCEEAACLSENLGTTLNNGGAPPTPPLTFSCGVTHNNLFYAFCPETGPVTLDITPSNCTVGDGVQAIIYETDDCVNFIENVCVSNGNDDPFQINFTGTPGQTYILMIDGFLGDVCDFTVTATGIENISGPPNDPILDPSDDPLVICNGDVIDVVVTNDDQNCTAYFWEVQSGLGVISIDVNGSTATVTGLAEGLAVLCVRADNFCYETETCIDVEVVAEPVLDPIPTQESCEQFVDFCDWRNFFMPPLNPDPDVEGWTISFHPSQTDAENDENEIICPYDLGTFGQTTIWIRIEAGNNCINTQSFVIDFIDCCFASAGGIDATPLSTCPGENINITVDGYFMDPEYDQYILIVDNSGTVSEVILGDSYTLTSDICAEFTIISYNHKITSSAPVPFVGMDPSTIDCEPIENCCDLEELNVRFEDNEPPVFTNPPTDLLITCFDALPPMPDLDYTDNCIDPGTVIGVESGSADLCAGGEVTRTWNIQDECGNETEHVQTITVNEPLPIAFTNFPPDNIAACDNIPGDAPPLDFTNNGAGSCLFEGSVDPIRTDAYDICGGTVTNFWEALDPCGNSISHTQVFTILEAPAPVFLNTPNDLRFTCDEFENNPPDLEYSNNASGDCLISGFVSPTSSPEPDICGGTMTNTWEYTDVCGRPISYTQTITRDPAPAPRFENPPSDITIQCGEIIPTDPLFYTNNADGECLIEGSVIPSTEPPSFPCRGIVINTWEYTDPCGNFISHSQTVTIEPAPQAEFLDFPEDITIECTEEITERDILEYSNFESGDCLIEGFVTAVRTGAFSACGGEVTFNWDFADPCGRIISHQQRITVLPGEQPEFLDYPPDDEIECTEIPEEPFALPYSNFDNFCPIEGEVLPQVTENYDSCGGEIIYVWEFTDECGNSISHTQILDVLPLLDPEFIDPPFDIDLECGEDVPPPMPLEYSNYETGRCGLNGFVMPTIDRNGQETIYTWTYENECTGNIIEHEQFIFNPLEPDLAINPEADTICQGESYDLSTIQIFDQNNSNAFYDFFEGFPPDFSNRLSDLNVSPSMTTLYSIVGNSQDDCNDTVDFELVVLQSPNAGADNNGYLCFGAQGVNLFDYLSGQDNNNGIWTDPLGHGIDISDPTNVSFVGESAGNYVFDYILGSSSCSGDTARIELELKEELRADIFTVQCSSDRNTYSVSLDAYGNQITVNTGTLNGPNGTEYLIDLIPVGQQLIIQVSNGLDSCINEIIIDPPNCDCPQIDPPVNLGNPNICEGESIPLLEVQVNIGEGANWYDRPNGGTLLQANSTTYQPNVSGPGTYTFYVEAYSLSESGCISNTRTPVILQINRIPEASDAVLETCDDDFDDVFSFELSLAEPDLSPTPSNSFEYFESLGDAQNQNNPLTSPYNNTSNPQTIFVVVSSPNGCDTIVELDLIVNPLPEIGLDIDNELCLGEENGSVQITSSSNNGSPEFSLNDFFYTTLSLFDSLSPGNYTAYVLDEKGCKNSENFEIEEGLQLSIGLFELECSDNGTNTDETDDFFTIRFNISNNKMMSGNFELVAGINSLGTFAYDADHQITLPADGSTITLQFIDELSSCQVTRNIGPLISCSTDCELTINSLDTLCIDNGTPLDPTDDYHTVTIRVSGINASPTNQYRLFVNGIREGIFDYDVDESFDVPVDGNPVLIEIEDLTDAQCRLSTSLGILMHCSNDCLVETEILQLLCDDAGTMGLEDDDIFTFYLAGNSINASDRWFVEGIQDTFSNGDSLFFGPFLILDGPITYIIWDAERRDCPDTVVVNPPMSCSNPCELVLNDLFISDCDDNNTGPTSDDDTYYIEFSVSVNFGPSTNFELTDGDTTWGPFNYGQLIRIENLTANGSTFSLVVQDTLSPQCVLEFEVQQDPCSSCDQTADAGPDFEITCAQPQVQLNGTSSESGIYTWTGPTTDTFYILNPLVDVPGVYFLTVLYDNACIVKDSMTITLDDDIPTVDAGPDTFLTCAITEIELIGTQLSGSSDVRGEWTDESGNILSNSFNLMVSSPGRYYFQIIDNQNACRSPRDEIIVGLNDEAPDPTIYADPSLILDCVVEEILLSTLDEDNVTYTWTIDRENFDGPVKIIVDSGLVLLTAYNTVNGCDSTNTINVEDFTEYPFIELEDPELINCYNPVVSIDANGSQRSNGLDIEWRDENGNIFNQEDYEVQVSNPGIYYFQLSDSVIGCTTLDSAIVDADLAPPLVDAGDNIQVLCNPDSIVTLSATSEGNGIINYTWSSNSGIILSGENTNSPNVEGEGYYLVDVLDSQNGCSSRDSVFVDINTDLPEFINLQTGDVRCFGENNGTINVLEVLGGIEPYTLSINGERQETNTTVGQLEPGAYQVEIVDGNNCTLDTIVNIREGLNFQTSVTPEIELEFGDSRLIYVLVNVPQDQILNVEWIPQEHLSCHSCLITEVYGVLDQNYEVIVTDSSGCQSRASVRVFVERNINIFAPNSFSPNGDGTNDFFTIYGDKSVTGIVSLGIFDRWGDEIFYQENFPANNPELGWDGKFKGEDLNPAVFVYYAEIELFDGTIELIKGDVSLFR